MTTHAKPRHAHSGRSEHVYAAIEAHGTAVAMGLLWLLPMLVFVVALLRL
jgi:hypothetical protein